MIDNLPGHWAIVGRGRLGTALAAALTEAGLRVAISQLAFLTKLVTAEKTAPAPA